MITLTLLHPLQSVAIQSWTFNNEPSIRIGRATDNQVVLYSAVVSRHHVEIRNTGASWQVINLSPNGTYVEGKPIEQTPALDGMIFRLAISGPQILVKIESESDEMQWDYLENQPKTKLLPKNAKDTLIS
ncbi:FHA domain-containing protein [Pleurocapsales cyanobacterium LEGE 10410]|nr:FHA domain-containing protein [Pleurocapsales cyanobacterium LEGE 10410]